MKNYKNLSELTHIFAQQNPDYPEGKTGRYHFSGDTFYVGSQIGAKFMGGCLVYTDWMLRGGWGTAYQFSRHLGDALGSFDTMVYTPFKVQDSIKANAAYLLDHAQWLYTNWAVHRKKPIAKYRVQEYYIRLAQAFVDLLTDEEKATLPSVTRIVSAEEYAAHQAKVAARRYSGTSHEVLFPHFANAVLALINKRKAEAPPQEGTLSPEDYWRTHGKFREEPYFIKDSEKVAFKYEGKRYTWVVGSPYRFDAYPDIRAAFGRKPWEHNNCLSHTCLRLNGEIVETSRGARVPVREARILFDRYKSDKDIMGFKIGAYTVLGKEAAGIKIGCHFLPTHEIELFAKTMGW